MKRLIKSFGYAVAGLFYAFRTQLNFKIQVLATVIVVAFGFYVNLTVNEWLWIAMAIAAVLIAELFNTAIEVLVDLVSPNYHPKAKIIKDCAAAAVVLAALLALVVAGFIFIPKLR